MRSPGGDWINVDASLVRVRGARQMALGAARSGCRTGFLGPLVKLLDRHGGNVLRSSRLVPANAKSRKWTDIVTVHFFTDAPSAVLLIHRRQQFAFTPLVPGGRIPRSARRQPLAIAGIVFCLCKALPRNQVTSCHLIFDLHPDRQYEPPAIPRRRRSRVV